MRFIPGDVDLYLYHDVTIGTFNWSGTVLAVYPTAPQVKFRVDNLGQPSIWRLELTGWLWLDTELALSNDLHLVITNSTGFGERVIPAVRQLRTVSGRGKLVLDCQTPNLNTFQLGLANAPPNTHSGGTRLKGHSSGKVYFEPMKNGYFGIGDVELDPFAKLILRNRFVTNDYIADTAALRLETANGTNRAWVFLEAGLNERLARLYIDDVQMPSGTYGSAASGAAEQLDDLLGGTGILTVLTGPPDPGKIRNFPPFRTNGLAFAIGGELVATNAAPTAVFVYWGSQDGGMDRNLWENEVYLGTRELGPFSVLITNYAQNQTLFY
ncbi:MAG: hypothetical protein NZ739_03855, partial [Verrucomicrobiae bacterium]|nr:hypothetical protein [Verrucomicrobiae bacterium]